jgi:hypothetical protein
MISFGMAPSLFRLPARWIVGEHPVGGAGSNNLYIVKIQIICLPAFVKQNLYTVKIATYKELHGEKTKTKQGEQSASPQPGKARGGETGGAAYPRSR